MTKNLTNSAPEKTAITVDDAIGVLVQLSKSGHGSQPLMIPVDPGTETVGCTPVVPFIGIHAGFDWDQGKVLVSTPTRLANAGPDFQKLKEAVRGLQYKLGHIYVVLSGSSKSTDTEKVAKGLDWVSKKRVEIQSVEAEEFFNEMLWTVSATRRGFDSIRQLLSKTAANPNKIGADDRVMEAKNWLCAFERNTVDIEAKVRRIYQDGEYPAQITEFFQQQYTIQRAATLMCQNFQKVPLDHIIADTLACLEPIEVANQKPAFSLR